MKRNVTLIASVVGGILLAAMLMTTMSTMAGFIFQPVSPAQPISTDDLVHQWIQIDQDLKELNYQVNLHTSGEELNLIEAIPDIEPVDVVRDGIPALGEIVTYYYTTTPSSIDGEGVDSYMFIAPKGWEILAISTPPGKNNSGCAPVPDVSSGYYNDAAMIEQSKAYWGNADLMPANLADLEPISPTQRSKCGPWIADGMSSYLYWVTLKVDPNAKTCPGTPRWVGIPYDPDKIFKWKPELDESMTMYLYGDGNGSGGTSVHTWQIQLQQPCPEPDITLEKTVGSLGDCPNSTFSEMDVPQGDEIEYCFKWYNTSGLVSVTHHIMTDSLLGTYTHEETLPAAFMSYLALPYVVTGTVGTSITNVATWTATTTEGYGQAPQELYTATFTMTQYTDESTDQAIVHIISPTGDMWDLYLPYLGDGTFPEYPKLVYPTNGEQLDTLIPTLEFDVGPSPGYPWARWYMATDPSQYGLFHNVPVTENTVKLGENLVPGTKYYWKVCFAETSSGPDMDCSPDWFFTSGSGGVLPGTPVLISPSDGATGVPLSSIVLSWSSAQDATQYKATIYEQGSLSRYSITTPFTTADFSGLANPNTVMEWFVKAKNDYGWSPTSPTWTFTTSGSRQGPTMH
jgi:hypothetical protein